MKKIILILCLIIVSQVETKAQQEKQFIDGTASTSSRFMYSSGNNSPVKDYDYYIRKKKSNLTAGVVTLGAGLLLSGIGWATASNSKSFDTDVTAAILLISGAASGIASIPLMIMATVYGHKAKVLLSNKQTGSRMPTNIPKYVTGITMAIQIGK